MNYLKLKKPDYIEDDRNAGITAVYCKCCGAEIRGMVADPQSERTERNGNKVIVRQNQMLTSHANYREIELHFKDGSAHVSNCCAKCINQLDNETVREMYLADLERFKSKGMNVDNLMKRELADKPFVVMEIE